MNALMFWRARPGAAKGTGPQLCGAMIGPPGGTVPLADWPLLTERCTAPATVTTQFRCREGHVDSVDKCDEHSRNGEDQICGYCATAGNRVPVTVSIMRRL